MNETWTIGIDLGGTNIKAIALAASGRRGELLSVPTPSGGGSKGVIDGIVAVVRRALAEVGGGKLEAVGIGTPGLVDEALTIRGTAVNLPEWERFSLKKVLEERLSVPTWGGNDVGLAAISEYELGAGHGAEVLVCIWLGTGIGGGILLSGTPFRGHNGIGGEIGHIVVEPGGRLCNCGQSGCVEAYGSANGMLALYRQEHPPAAGTATLTDFAAALRAEEPAAVVAHDVACNMLSRLTGTVLNVFAPDRIVFGGGVAQAGIPLIEPITARLAEYALPATRSQCAFALSNLGASAGPLGAALLAHRKVTSW
ncbi:MAG TPA: ROK family protein [Spirochaetia bacterium]|nr:ROK family protein [Spirochaetia bacterium]